MAVVKGVGGVPVLLHLLQPGVVVPVPRAPVRPRATGEVGVLYRRLEIIMEFPINFFLNDLKRQELNGKFQLLFHSILPLL